MLYSSVRRIRAKTRARDPRCAPFSCPRPLPTWWLPTATATAPLSPQAPTPSALPTSHPASACSGNDTGPPTPVCSTRIRVGWGRDGWFGRGVCSNRTGDRRTGSPQRRTGWCGVHSKRKDNSCDVVSKSLDIHLRWVMQGVRRDRDGS